MDPTIPARLRRLRAEAAAIGALLEERVALPRTGDAYRIVRPAETDPLLDRVAHDPEQNLPYWAELWPSGVALADAIAARPDRLRDARALELGAGLGVTAIAALRAGAGAQFDPALVEPFIATIASLALEAEWANAMLVAAAPLPSPRPVAEPVAVGD